ncbi:MAG: aminoglycoside phosphotransferase [Halioglobus sp.]|nr:aminoglycoside phosphotransferase [Halioglobus sp.]
MAQQAITALDTALAALLAREIDAGAQLDGCTQLTAGASQETWCVSYRDAAGDTLRLALRRAQPTAGQAAAVGGISLATEARLLQLAAAAGVPCPAVRYVLQPGDGLGDGFLMQWLQGETLGKRIVQSPQLAQVRPRLARECGRVLAQVHAIDWRAARLDDHLPVVDPATLVDETFAVYRELDAPQPMIDYCWRWLREHLPRRSRTALVHGDFRNGNLMVNEHGIVAVLDWELAHIGDPVRDLGWLCVNSWRFGNAALPVGGFGAIDELLDGYNEAAGTDVSADELAFWQVFGSFWWAAVTLQMAQGWRSGETPSLERPVIGRRSSEAQMDCVNLLIPGDYPLPEADRALDTGTQLPMPAELIEGVAAFLKEELAPDLDPHRQFLARVGANSLRIAQRELLYGAELARAEHEQLRQLLDASGDLDALRRELSARLRDDLPLDTPGLADHLRQTVAGRLFVDQPRYWALRRD